MCTHPGHFTDVCGIEEGRKAGKEVRRKDRGRGGKKEENTSQQGGGWKGKEKAKIYKETSACRAVGSSVSV